MKGFNLKSTLSAFSSFLLLAGAMTCASTSQAQTSATNIQISNSVVQTPVHRLGVNLGDQGYWDSAQMMKNLVFTNPGFEGLQYRTIFHCSSVTANSCKDDNGYNGQPNGYWTGGSYLVISGAANGTSGTVVNNALSTTTCGSCGPTLQFDQNVNMAAGDYVVLTKYFSGAGDAGWWKSTKGGGTITTETADLSPETAGKQAILLTASQTGQQAVMTQYFESYANLSFIQLNGSFEVTFRAKAVGGNNQMYVNVNRAQAGLNAYLSQTLTLTNQWQDYRLTFNASETGSAVGTVSLSFNATGSSVELDDVSLDQTNSSSANPTVFRDDVVNALKQLNPGTIRMMAAGAALGSDIPNQLQIPSARYRGGFNADATSEANIAYGIHEFLQLCQTVGSDPWITIPTATTPQEMTEFIQYLTGNGSDTFSALRIARGQVAPWTSVFNKIHIELGNETWNGDFKGESMSIPAYPQWANQVFGAARQTSGFKASNFDLVIDGWSQVPWYDTQILSVSTQHDAIDMAPYLMYSLNNEPQSTMFGAMMAEPEMFESTGGIVNQIVTGAQTAPTPTRVNVYETNLGTMIGSPTAAQLAAIAPSIAAGITTTNHMLQMMRLGVQYQNAFALPQFAFRRGDGQSVKLWGIVVDMGTTNRRRPQFLTQAMANSVVGGNMLQTSQTGANPTWNQPLSSDNVQMAAAHYLQSFAFLNGQAASTVVFNLSLTNALPVTFSGANAPTGNVQMTQITSANMTDNNETADVVEPTTQTLNGFNAAAGLSLPPFSMTVLSWTSTVAQAPQFSLVAGNYSTSQTVSMINTTPNATTYYTTDGSTPTVNSNLYTGPITISNTTTLNAITTAANLTNSPVTSAIYTIQPLAAVPTIQLPAGTYSTTQSVAITSSPGMSIFYTTDGSAPTTQSHLYSGPVMISSSATVNAIAAAQNFTNSPVATAAYVIAPPTPAPYFTTPAGSYTTQQTVAILDQTGAAIYFTTDGSTPTQNSRLYSSTLTISVTGLIKAIAIAPGYSSSPVTSAAYTISTLAATPQFSVAGGTYDVPQSLSFASTTAGAVIHYTLDGSTPTAASPVFTSPVTIDATQYVSAAAMATGYKTSYIATGMFTMVSAAPTTSLAAGSYTGSQTIALSTITPNTAIFYTLDGSTPTTQSTCYTGPIVMNASGTINAMARRKGYNNSTITSAAYIINPPAATPVLSLAAGTYPTTQLVTITDASAGSAIYYTLDGTTPSVTSALYNGAITVGATETLNAQAFINGAQGSAIASASYVIAKASLVPFTNSFSTNQVHVNGSAKVLGSNLQLVSGLAAQGGSAWFTSKVSVTSFTNDFDFSLPVSNSNGFTFTLQNSGAATTALGLNSSGMAYATIKNSVAVAFGFYQAGDANAESVGVYTGGVIPQGNAVNLETTGINLHNGDTFHVRISYSATVLTVVITDKQTGATATETFPVDVVNTIGSSSAYVGFTGATGGHTSVQNILDWTYTN